MSNFKIIAIKTGENGESPRNFLESSVNGVDINYLKNLKPNTVYNLHNDYTFPKNNFTTIECEKRNEINLYKIQLSNKKEIPVNINAIVGVNGSGKSTLIELIYWMNYNLGCKFNLLKLVYKNKEIPYLINEQLDLELFYQVEDNLYYILKFYEGNIKKLKVNFKSNVFTLPNEPKWEPINEIRDITDFFYSIVVNYSQYALNALEVGEWINPLFHKNDGYQTPMVLNPMRRDGNIDINEERLLLSRRLQSNVLEKIAVGVDVKDSLRNLSNGKIATTLEVKFNQDYLTKINKKYGEIQPMESESIITGLETHFDFKYEVKGKDYNYFVASISEYIYYKLKKIVSKYPDFTEFNEENFNENIPKILEEIKNSNSHITFKVKGAIMHLKYFDDIYKDSKFNFDDAFNIDISYFSDVIHNSIQQEESFLVNTYMMALPSFFNVDILPDKNLSLNNFSSGEKQKIFSLSSIIYHLINLNSVEKAGSNFINYKYINIILDEIEMYYHPEWQRKYINDFIEYAEKVNPDSLRGIEGINITFLTHSPFILSDIPNENILMLEVKDGYSLPKKNISKTFGANIHDLLVDSFFMTSTIGEYAQKKIKEIVDFYYRVKFRTSKSKKGQLLEEYKMKEEEFHYIVSSIGEDVIKGIIENHIEYIEEELLEKSNRSRIERLEEEIVLKRNEIKRLKQDD